MFTNYPSNIVKFFNEKHFLLKGQLPSLTDENKKETKNKHRVFRDVTTNIFVDNFLNDTEQRYNFLDYTFHKLNSDIQININNKLIEQKHSPLIDSESVILIFKGGNIMHEMGISEIKKLKSYSVNLENIKSTCKMNFKKFSDESDSKNVLKNIESKLKISDVDYSVYIIADNFNRYNLIYDIVLKILVKSLDEITTFFDTLFDNYKNKNTNDNNEKKINSDENLKNNDSDNEYEELLKMFNQLKQYKNLTSEQKNELQLFLNETFENYNNNLSSLDLDYLLNLYNYIILYDHFNNGNFNKNFLSTIETQIQNLIQSKKNKLYNFYTKKQIDKFLSDLVEKFKKTDFDEIYYEYYNDGLTESNKKYTINKTNINIDKFNISKRNNLIISSDNHPDKFHKRYAIQDTPKYHYITFNNIIKVSRANNSSIINFDLLRSKFNVSIKDSIKVDGEFKTVNIPSEFIDISIPKFNSFNNENLLSHFSINNIFYNESNSVSINTYNIKEIYHDLIHVIFSFFCPWVDFKYEKRIIRTIYFLFLYCRPHNKSHNKSHNKMTIFFDLIELANSLLKIFSNYNDINDTNIINNKEKIYNKLKPFYEKFLLSSPSFFTDKITHMLKNKNASFPFYDVLVKYDYELISVVIANILHFSYLFLLNSQDFISINNQFRKYYHYVPVLDNEIKKTYFEKFTEMLSIFNDYGYTLYYLYNNLCTGSQAGGVKFQNRNKIGFQNRNKFSFQNRNEKNTKKYLPPYSKKISYSNKSIFEKNINYLKKQLKQLTKLLNKYLINDYDLILIKYVKNIIEKLEYIKNNYYLFNKSQFLININNLFNNYYSIKKKYKFNNNRPLRYLLNNIDDLINNYHSYYSENKSSDTQDQSSTYKDNMMDISEKKSFDDSKIIFHKPIELTSENSDIKIIQKTISFPYSFSSNPSIYYSDYKDYYDF